MTKEQVKRMDKEFKKTFGNPIKTGKGLQVYDNRKPILGLIGWKRK